MPGRFFPLLLLLLFVPLAVAPASGIVIVEYFHQPGCINCAQTDPLIDALEAKYAGRVRVERVSVDDRAGAMRLLSYGVTEIPVVVINRNKVMTWPGITAGSLDDGIRLAESGAYPVPERRRSLLDADGPLPVLASFILGLLTGFSPCLLGSLAVLAAAGTGTPQAGSRNRYYPLVFGAGIIAAYLAATGAILWAGVAFRPDEGARLLIHVVAGLIAIATGLLQLGLVSLPGRIQDRAAGLVLRFRSFPGIFLLGILFSLLFAPCAMAPFLVLTGALLLGQGYAAASMLAAFAAGIFVPFLALAIMGMAVPGKQALRFAGIARNLGGILLVGFGIWLLIW